jgi:small subunit ribosomal protein S20
MANHKSAEKYNLQSKKRNLANRSRFSMVKTMIKKLDSTIESKNEDNAREFFKLVQSNIAKCVKHGILKANTASRKISRIHQKIKNTFSKTS